MRLAVTHVCDVSGSDNSEPGWEREEKNILGSCCSFYGQSYENKCPALLQGELTVKIISQLLLQLSSPVPGLANMKMKILRRRGKGNIRLQKSKIPKNFSSYPLVCKNWISWSMNFYLLASSVCISELDMDCHIGLNLRFLAFRKVVWIWLTLMLDLWHFSSCQSVWLTREFGKSLSPFLRSLTFSLNSWQSSRQSRSSVPHWRPDCSPWPLIACPDITRSQKREEDRF